MNVMIGIDPHKASHTAVAIDGGEDQLSSVKVRATHRQVDQLMSWAAEVEASLKAMLPPDVAFPPVTLDKNAGSCGMLNIMSPTLAKELAAPKIGDPQGVIGIELNSINANLDSFYDPSNIQTASLQPLAVDPTQGC